VAFLIVLADRRAYAAMLRLSSSPVVCDVCIVAKGCVL